MTTRAWPIVYNENVQKISPHTRTYTTGQTSIPSIDLQQSATNVGNQSTVQQENSANTGGLFVRNDRTHFQDTTPTNFYSQIKNMPLFPYLPNTTLQPITPTTQSLQSLLSPTSSSAPFLSMMFPTSQNETQNTSTSNHNSNTLFSPTSNPVTPSTFPSLQPSIAPLPPPQGKQV